MNPKFNKWILDVYGKDAPMNFSLAGMEQSFLAGQEAIESYPGETVQTRAFTKRVISCLNEISKHEFESEKDKEACLNFIEVCRLLIQQEAAVIAKKVSEERALNGTA